MKEYNKPLPKIFPWSQRFWEGAKQHKLLLQKCKNCGTVNHPPYLFCGECMGEEFEWIESSGKGKLYSFTTQIAGLPPSFVKDAPYTVAMVDLEEGVRILTNLVNCDPSLLKCDMGVEVVFDEVTTDFTLPRFKPTKPLK